MNGGSGSRSNSNRHASCIALSLAEYERRGSVKRGGLSWDTCTVAKSFPPTIVTSSTPSWLTYVETNEDRQSIGPSLDTSRSNERTIDLHIYLDIDIMRTFSGTSSSFVSSDSTIFCSSSSSCVNQARHSASSNVLFLSLSHPVNKMLIFSSFNSSSLKPRFSKRRLNSAFLSPPVT